MRRMLDKMGLEMKDLGNIEEVIIKTETKELYLIKPQVVEMKGKDTWDKGRYIEKQSWAIMPGEDKPDSKVADACAKQLAAKA